MKRFSTGAIALNRRQRTGCRLLAVTSILVLCGLSMRGEAQAALSVDSMEVNAMEALVEMPDTVAFNEVMTVSEFAMIMSEAGIELSFAGGKNPYVCLLCMLANPKHPELCAEYCEDQ